MSKKTKKPRILILAMAVIRKEDRVFVNESREPTTGEVFYRPLGGKIEFGERGEDAVAREFMEEIGAEVVNIRYLKAFESIFTYAGRPGHEIILMYEADFMDGSFYECGEIVSERHKDEPIRASWKSIEFFKESKAPLYPEGLLESLVGPKIQQAHRSRRCRETGHMSYAGSLVFKPADYGMLSLRNRIVMAPMTRRKAGEDGVITEESVAYYRRRAAGEVGLIISEGVPIDSIHAADGPTVPHMETAEQIAAWRRVVDAVHDAGGAIAPQLWHTGPKAMVPIGPSAGPAAARKDGEVRPDVIAMTDADFQQVIGAFTSAARNSKDIGCDAVEIHGAHGYLLDAFLCPGTNKRTDEYGGSIENRLRFPLQVVRAVRDVVGSSYPIIYRISQWKSEDKEKIKFRKPADLEPVVTGLREAGVDILHVSTERALDPAFAEVPDRTLAGWTRELSGLPTIAVGAVSLGQTCNDSYGGQVAATADPGVEIRLIEEGEADMLAVGRSLIPNPDWVRIVHDGDWRDLKPFAMSDLDTLV